MPESFIERNPNNNDQIQKMIYAYGKTGDREKAMSYFEMLNNIFDSRGLDMKDYNNALMCTAMGNIDVTFEILNRMFEKRDSTLPYINSFYEWEPLRSDPRFKALLKKMGLPED